MAPSNSSTSSSNASPVILTGRSNLIPSANATLAQLIAADQAQLELKWEFVLVTSSDTYKTGYWRLVGTNEPVLIAVTGIVQAESRLDTLGTQYDLPLDKVTVRSGLYHSMAHVLY